MLGCVIQARMGSTRFPGKVMKIVDGNNPSIFYTINQLKCCNDIEKIIVATTVNSEDNIIYNYVKSIGVDVFRGDPDNVLDRYYRCASDYSLSAIIRVTADCPLIDPNIVNKGIDLFVKGKYDYVTNTFPRSYPDGNETEIFTYKSLNHVWKNAKLPSEKEHVTPFYKNNFKKFNTKNFSNNLNLSHLRWTVDYAEDYELIKAILSRINKRPVRLDDILYLIKIEPELLKINEGHKPEENYFHSLKKDKEYLLERRSNGN